MQVPGPSPLPPLVAPAAELTRDEIARYSRHLLIPEFGALGQRRLKNARVLVIGAGGLGAPTLLYLAAAGVGTIGIVDFDVVDESNLQRQIIHGQADVGRLKTHSAADSIRAINPLVDVVCHDLQLTSDNVADLFAGYDLILDGADNFATRYLVNDAAALAGKPYVWGSIRRFSGQVSVFWDAAPDGRGVTLRDVFPEPPAPGTVPSCAEGGVLGVLCGAVASLMGTEAIKLITGIGQSLLGRLLLYDALAMTHRTLNVARDPARAPITELIDYELFCGVVPDAAPAEASISPAELHRLRAEAVPLALVDVREPAEWEINRIDGAVLIPKSEFDAGTGADRLPPGRVVLYCKSGVRSAAVAETLRAAGVDDVVSLTGGILAWAQQFDPDMVSY